MTMTPDPARDMANQAALLPDAQATGQLGGGVGGKGDKMICDNCGAHTLDANVRRAVCGGPVLCTTCDWVHWDECAVCRSYHAEDEAKLRAWSWRRKHPEEAE